MFKTSARRREQVRRSKLRHPPKQNTAAKTQWRRDHKHRQNELRNAKRHRDGVRQRVDTNEQIERFAGLSIVSQASLTKDRTRWRGRGWITEEKLSALADRILAALKRGRKLDTEAIDREIARIRGLP